MTINVLYISGEQGGTTKAKPTKHSSELFLSKKQSQGVLKYFLHSYIHIRIVETSYSASGSIRAPYCFGLSIYLNFLLNSSAIFYIKAG